MWVASPNFAVVADSQNVLHKVFLVTTPPIEKTTVL